MYFFYFYIFNSCPYFYFVFKEYIFKQFGILANSTKLARLFQKKKFCFVRSRLLLVVLFASVMILSNGFEVSSILFLSFFSFFQYFESGISDLFKNEINNNNCNQMGTTEFLHRRPLEAGVLYKQVNLMIYQCVQEVLPDCCCSSG